MSENSLLHKVNESAVIVRVLIYLLIGAISIGIAYGVLESDIDRQSEINNRQQLSIEKMDTQCHTLITSSAVQESTVDRMNDDIIELKGLVHRQNDLLERIIVHEKGK